MHVYVLNHVQLCTPWTVVHQAPLSMGFPRQEYWSGYAFCLKKIYNACSSLEQNIQENFQLF